MAASQANLPGVIIFRLQDMRPDHVNGHLKAILQQHTESLQAGAILSVRERRVWVRRLPIR